MDEQKRIIHDYRDLQWRDASDAQGDYLWAEGVGCPTMIIRMQGAMWRATVSSRAPGDDPAGDPDQRLIDEYFDESQARTEAAIWDAQLLADQVRSGKHPKYKDTNVVVIATEDDVQEKVAPS